VPRHQSSDGDAGTGDHHLLTTLHVLQKLRQVGLGLAHIHQLRHQFRNQRRHGLLHDRRGLNSQRTSRPSATAVRAEHAHGFELDQHSTDPVDDIAGMGEGLLALQSAKGGEHSNTLPNCIAHPKKAAGTI
jgi:hypothetical protein